MTPDDSQERGNEEPPREPVPATDQCRMESQSPEPVPAGPNPPLRRPRAAIVFVQSILFGLLFVPVVIAVLFAIAGVERWRYGEWHIYWIYERGGFPCIGLFAIASAAYFTMRLMPCRFVKSLLIVAGGAFLCWMLCGNVDLMPHMYKGTQIHWLRPAFIGWLLIPPWTTAIISVSVRRNAGHH
jgi:hypothetical protein